MLFSTEESSVELGDRKGVVASDPFYFHRIRTPEAIIPGRSALPPDIRIVPQKIVKSYCSYLFYIGLSSRGIRDRKGVVASDPFDFPQVSDAQTEIKEELRANRPQLIR